MWKRYDPPDSYTDGYQVTATIDAFEGDAEVWLDTEAVLHNGHDGICLGSCTTERAALRDAAKALSLALAVVMRALCKEETDVTDLPQGGDCD